MSYRKPRTPHWMDVCALFFGARYVVCGHQGCVRVIRAKDMKPLIHKGRKP